MNPTLVASPPRRHHLSAMRPMKSSQLRGLAGSSTKNSTFSTATKRSLNDENLADPSLAFLASPTKRVKSALSKTVDQKLKSASGIQNFGARPQKRAFGALLDITNTRAHSTQPPPPKDGKSAFAKSALGKPRTILKPSVKKVSPVRSPPSPRRILGRPPSPRIAPGRGIKRAYSPPTFKRVDPPASIASRQLAGSIDSLLSGLPRATDAPSLAKPEAAPLIATNVPDSWVFDIYEDSPEETLQNLMEHSTHTLDISDDSDSEAISELQEKGKENIPPARLAELMALPSEDRINAMSVDLEIALIPQRRAAGAGPGGRVLREHREVLREMSEDELLAPPEDIVLKEDGVKVPTLKSEAFFEFSTPEKEKRESSPAPSSPGWQIWESDHEGDKEGSPEPQEPKAKAEDQVPPSPSGSDKEN